MTKHFTCLQRCDYGTAFRICGSATRMAATMPFRPATCAIRDERGAACELNSIDICLTDENRYMTRTFALRTPARREFRRTRLYASTNSRLTSIAH